MIIMREADNLRQVFEVSIAYDQNGVRVVAVIQTEGTFQILGQCPDTVLIYKIDDCRRSFGHKDK